MDIKIGANGDFKMSVNTDGDIVLSISDAEVDSSQSAQIIIHQDIVIATLVQFLGGGSLAQLIVKNAVDSLASAIANS